MASVKLHPREAAPKDASANSFPPLIQTPSGLAILELPGTINLPESQGNQPNDIEIGRVSFPDYNPNVLDPSNTSWMKTVQLYVGKHQRLTGEVKKLPKALAVIRKRDAGTEKPQEGDEDRMLDEDSADLEVVEIVKYKLVFSSRPEPVGTS